MRTEEWIEKEKQRINKGMSKIDDEMEKTQAEYDKILNLGSEAFYDEENKLGYITGKINKLAQEKMQNRGKIKIINKILEVKC